jgi:hypothetical protein
MNHIPRRLLKSRLADVMALFFLENNLPDIRHQFMVGSTSQHAAIKIVIALRKQTGTQLAV